MARKLRAQCPGAIYHAMNCGDVREAFSLDNRDRELEEWCLGSDELRQELLAWVSELAGWEHRGEDIGESAQEKAEQIVREGPGTPGRRRARPGGPPQGRSSEAEDCRASAT
jgi:hypothetical protein